MSPAACCSSVGPSSGRVRDERERSPVSGVLPGMTRRTDPWTGLAFDSWRLAWEASTVIGLRLAKFASLSPDSPAEAQRMVQEKVKAAIDLQRKAMTGALGTTPPAAARKAVAQYRKAVGANRRRLTKGRK